MCASTSSISANGIRFQEKRRLRSAIFNQKWRWYSAAVSLQSSRPSCNRSHTCQRRLPVPDLNEDFIPASGDWHARDASFISRYFIIICVFSFIAQRPSDKMIEVWLKSARTLLGCLLELILYVALEACDVSHGFVQTSRSHKTNSSWFLVFRSEWDVVKNSRSLSSFTWCVFPRVVLVSFTSLTDNCFKSVACKRGHCEAKPLSFHPKLHDDQWFSTNGLFVGKFKRFNR